MLWYHNWSQSSWRVKDSSTSSSLCQQDAMMNFTERDYSDTDVHLLQVCVKWNIPDCIRLLIGWRWVMAQLPAAVEVLSHSAAVPSTSAASSHRYEAGDTFTLRLIRQRGHMWTRPLLNSSVASKLLEHVVLSLPETGAVVTELFGPCRRSRPRQSRNIKQFRDVHLRTSRTNEINELIQTFPVHLCLKTELCTAGGRPTLAPVCTSATYSLQWRCFCFSFF